MSIAADEFKEIESSLSLFELKTIFSGLVFISGGVGVLLPWVLGRRAAAARFMAWGNAFAGGVLGGAGLVHLLSGGAGECRAILIRGCR